jgi:hypothetical protein
MHPIEKEFSMIRNFVRSRIAIESVIAEYTTLERVGLNGLRGPSPLKSESGLEIQINEAKQVFYCAATKQGGDVIDFLMNLKGISLLEALDQLAVRIEMNLAGTRLVAVSTVHSNPIPADMQFNTLERVWQQVCDHIREAIPNVEFHTWFSRARLIGLTDDECVIGTTSSFASDWLQHHYVDVLEAALEKLGISGRRIEFRFGERLSLA